MRATQLKFSPFWPICIYYRIILIPNNFQVGDSLQDEAQKLFHKTVKLLEPLMPPRSKKNTSGKHGGWFYKIHGWTRLCVWGKRSRPEAAYEGGSCTVIIHFFSHYHAPS